LRSWQQPDGTRAHQVQALDTGEMMTVVESATAATIAGAGGSRVRAVSTQIFHWGVGKTTPPPGTPMPPDAASGVRVADRDQHPTPKPAAPTPPPGPARNLYPASPTPVADTRPATPPPPPPAAPPVAPPPPAAPAKPTVVARINPVNSDCGCNPCNPPAPDGRLTPTPSGNGEVIVLPPVVEERRGLLGFLRGRSNECNSCGTCEGATTPPAPVVVEGPVVDKPPRQGLVSRWLHHGEGTEVPLPPAPPVQTVTIPVPTPSAEVTKAPPSNFRESWGQVEPWRPNLSEDQTAKKTPSKSGPTAAQGEQPGDPLKNPAWYHQQALAELARKAAERSKPSEHVGMASVEAAGAGPLPPGLAQMPGLGQMPAPGPMSPPPLPPDPFRTSRAMPMYGPGPGLRRDQGIPDAMANAFTPGGTTRPIPSDFGTVHYPDNAWSAPSADAYYAAMASQSRQPIAQPNAFLFPGMPAPAVAQGPMPGAVPGMAGVPALPGAVPGMAGMLPGYGVRSPLMHVPAQQPMVLPASQSHAPATMGTDTSAALPEQATPERLVEVLKTALYPSQREYAAQCLASEDWRTHSKVVEALLAGAKADPAPAVRAGCVRALAHMKVNTPDAVALVESLKFDTDARVRQAASDALADLGIPMDSGIRPASGQR
jgi:hypothetical protein